LRSTPRRQSIAQVLARAGSSRLDITAVAAGTGPGPYTGLRAGLVNARVLGSALGVPVHGICTLDVIAADALTAAAGRDFVVATDARRREVYWARYDAAGARLTGPAVGTPAAVAAEIPAGTPVAGAGALLYPDLLGGPGEPGYPSAATLARLAAQRIAAGLPALGADPVYLRRPDARVPGPPKRVTVP
jgi:tRNA threonylcarbamoyl adenosine modification protein YeaZ